MLPASPEVREGEPLLLRMIAFSSFISQIDPTNTKHTEIRSQEQVGKMILFGFNMSYSRQPSQFLF